MMWKTELRGCVPGRRLSCQTLCLLCNKIERPFGDTVVRDPRVPGMFLSRVSVVTRLTIGRRVPSGPGESRSGLI